MFVARKTFWREDLSLMAKKKESTLKKRAALNCLAYKVDKHATRELMYREQYKHFPHRQKPTKCEGSGVDDG
jgi:hypothetical protein